MKNTNIFLIIMAIIFSFWETTWALPNIVLIVADDLGWKDVGYNGSQFYETPHIDRLAFQGMTFTNAYANAPVCGPSRAALMSGQYPARTGFYTNGSSARGRAALRKVIPTPNKNELGADNFTMAECLKTAGYQTAFIGKWHLGSDKELWPRAQGFDINVAGWRSGKPKSYFSPYQNPLLEDGPDGEYLTDRLTREAIDVLNKFKNNNNADPFFLTLAYYSPHTPIQAKDEYVWDFIPKPAHNGQYDPIYAGMIKSLDEGVGNVMQTLEDLNLKDSTLVIFTSDHGGLHAVTSNEPLRAYKGSLYEGGLRVPFVARWPGKIAEGTTTHQPIMLADLYPTFKELAKGETPENHVLDGKNILPLFLQKGKVSREAIYWHFPAYLQVVYGGLNKHWRTTPVSVIRKGNYKLMEFLEDGHLELYNLRENISESASQNLADQLPEKTQELKKLLYAWRDSMNVAHTLKENTAFEPETLRGPPLIPRSRKAIYK